MTRHAEIKTGANEAAWLGADMPRYIERIAQLVERTLSKRAYFLKAQRLTAQRKQGFLIQGSTGQGSKDVPQRLRRHGNVLDRLVSSFSISPPRLPAWAGSR